MASGGMLIVSFANLLGVILDNLRVEQLDNGLRVIVAEDNTTPVVSCWVAYRVGSRNERPGITGISHFLEHMLFRRTGKYPDGMIDRLISRVGGHFNAFTSEDVTMYYETLPRRGLETALDIEAERMSNAVLEDQVAEIERKIIISELEMAENYPWERLGMLVKATALVAHPYRWPVIGWRSDVESITARELRGFYETYYTPSNATLAIAGNISFDEARRMVREKFGDIEDRGRPPEPRTREPEQEGERRVVLRLPGKVRYVYIAYHAPSIDDEDFSRLLVLDAVLGGAKSFNPMSGISFVRSSLLYERLVRSGYASSVGTSLQPSIDPFLYVIKLTVRSGVEASEAERRALDVIGEISSKGVGEEFVERAKMQIVAQMAYSVENVTGQGLMYGFMDRVSSIDRLRTLTEEVKAVTGEDLRGFAGSFMSEEGRTVGVFEPSGVG